MIQKIIIRKYLQIGQIVYQDIIDLSCSLKINMQFLLKKILRHRIIIFELDYSGLIQYVEPLIQEISRRKLNVDIFISYGNHKVIADSKDLNIPVSNYFSSGCARFLIFQDVFISPTQWAKCPKFGKKICMFHGQPSKNTTFIPNLIKNYNCLFFISPLQKEFFTTKFLEENEEFKSIETYDIGYPKSDKFFNGSYDKKEIVSALNFSHEKITVIYSPSYEEGTSLREFGEQVIQQLVQLDINLLVKLHPASLSPEGDPAGTQHIDWIEKLKKFETFSNYRFLNTKLIDPYLIVSDIMVTDVSGVALEFMNLDKPIIYFESQKFYEKYLPEKFGFDIINAHEDIFCNVGRNAGLIIKSPEELPAAINRSISKPAEFSSKRKEILKKLTFNKGHAAKEFIDKLLDLV